jgi:Ca2+:H+ antiporter
METEVALHAKPPGTPNGAGHGPSLWDKVAYGLLLFVPISVALSVMKAGDVWVFAAACAAIIPLAKVMGTATEALAARAGATIGGFLNATFGNAGELILAFFALKAGLFDIVKASLIGSILGNSLLVLGLALLVGGWKREKQLFSRTLAQTSSTTMLIAVAALVMPAAFVLTAPTVAKTAIGPLSIGVAILMLVVYSGSLLFTLKTHAHLFGGDDLAEEHPAMPMKVAVGVLLGATVLVAYEAELLVHAVEHVTHALHLSPLFIGVILIPLIGNAAEHLTAVTAAAKDKMDLALGIVTGSSAQIALFVAPVLVLVGWATGKPLDLSFGLFEIAALLVAIALAIQICNDGETNWLEGLQLLVCYAILGVAFFYHP